MVIGAVRSRRWPLPSLADPIAAATFPRRVDGRGRCALRRVSGGAGAVGGARRWRRGHRRWRTAPVVLLAARSSRAVCAAARVGRRGRLEGAAVAAWGSSAPTRPVCRRSPSSPVGGGRCGASRATRCGLEGAAVAARASSVSTAPVVPVGHLLCRGRCALQRVSAARVRLEGAAGRRGDRRCGLRRCCIPCASWSSAVCAAARGGRRNAGSEGAAVAARGSSVPTAPVLVVGVSRSTDPEGVGARADRRATCVDSMRTAQASTDLQRPPSVSDPSPSVTVKVLVSGCFRAPNRLASYTCSTSGSGPVGGWGRGLRSCRRVRVRARRPGGRDRAATHPARRRRSGGAGCARRARDLRPRLRAEDRQLAGP